MSGSCFKYFFTSLLIPSELGTKYNSFLVDKDKFSTAIFDTYGYTLEPVSSTEATTSTDTTNWGDYYNLQGAQLKIIYDTAPPPVPENSDAKVSVTGSNLSISGNFSIT